MKNILFLSGLVALLLVGCTSNKLELFVVNGAAMEPIFPDGKHLLVDTSVSTFVLDDVVVYTNENGNVILGRITGLNDGLYEISPDNTELGVNVQEYMPADTDSIIGTATLCSEGQFKCWLQAF